MSDAPCAGCGKPMGDGDYDEAEVDGKTLEFHPQCFHCARCRGEFPNGEYFVEKGKLYCSDKCADAANKLVKTKEAPKPTDKCADCGKDIMEGDEFFAVKDGKDSAVKRAYHPECFKCPECGKPIGKERYWIDHGLPVHEACKHGGVRADYHGGEKEFDADETCARCGDRIRGQKKVVPDFGTFHLSCFKCCKCNLGITKEFYKDPAGSGGALCHRCKP